MSSSISSSILFATRRGIAELYDTSGRYGRQKPLKYKEFVEFIYVKPVADNGYICKNLFQRLFVDSVQLITKLKSSLKGVLMRVSDKLLFRKRTIIETANNELRTVPKWSTQGTGVLTIPS